MAPRPTLSFCITTRGPAARTRALLEVVRPHVDEVVLAVDRRGDPDVLEACADLADRRLTFELDRSPVWLVGWLMHQCRGDWLLRLDDDEVPSASLLDALPELIGDRYPTVYRLPRRWLSGTPDRYLTSFPWSLERQARLVRNVPSLWRFEGRVHMSGRWLGEVRTTDLALYHLVLLTRSADERRAKRDRYLRLEPGLAFEEFALDDMYVPEDLPAPQTAAVPAEDQALVARLLEPRSLPPGYDGRPDAEHASPAEIALFNTDRPVSPGAYDAEIRLVTPRAGLAPGVVRHFEAMVDNRGDELWRPEEGSQAFAIGWRWREAESGRPLRQEGRVPFTETVLPGRSTRLELAIPTPPLPGDYDLVLDVVHEHVRWFERPVTHRVAVRRGAADGNSAAV